MALCQLRRYPSTLPPSSNASRRWSAGDYAIIGTTLQIVGERFAVRGRRPASRQPGARCRRRKRECDAGCGTPLCARHVNRLCRCSSRAWQGARGRRTPFPSPGKRTPKRCHSPTAASTWRCPRSASCLLRTRKKAAAELVRVVRKGGTIGLANWTPDGFVGRLLKMVGQYICPRLPASGRQLCGALRLTLANCSRP